MSPDELVEKNLRLVNWVVGRMRYRPLELEEALAWGRFGLFQAARKYDPANGASFPSFAIQRIKGAVLDERRKIDTIDRRGHERPYVHSLDSMLHSDTGDDSTFDVPDEDAPAPYFPDDQWRHLTSVLDEREQALVYMLYSAEMPLARIAEYFGLSESRASQLHKRALKKMRALAA